MTNNNIISGSIFSQTGDALVGGALRQGTPINQPDPPVYKKVGDKKIAMQIQLPNTCPECGYQYYIEKKDIRYVFTHSDGGICSRSMTTFSRPIAQFTVFI